MAWTKEALKAEILNDPMGYGYAQGVNSGQDWFIADLLNHLDEVGVREL